jgi:hypothetical protein
LNTFFAEKSIAPPARRFEKVKIYILTFFTQSSQRKFPQRTESDAIKKIIFDNKSALSSLEKTKQISSPIAKQTLKPEKGPKPFQVP